MIANNLQSIAEKIAKEYSEQVATQVRPKEQACERHKQDILHAFEHYQGEIQKGLELLHQKTTNFELRMVLGKLQACKTQEEWKKTRRAMEGDTFSSLFGLAREAYARGEFREVQTMLMPLMILYPDRMQLYIFSASAAWESEGIQAAVNIYDLCTSLFEDPLCFHYAADCYEAYGDNVKAQGLWQKALSLCENSEAFADPELKKEIEGRLQRVA